MDKATIIFQPSGHRGKISKGKNVLEAARELERILNRYAVEKGHVESARC